MNSDIETVTNFIVSQHCKKLWNLDIPNELLTIINNYCPWIFWELGDPCFTMNDNFDVPSDFVGTDFLYKQAFFVENKQPRTPILCTVKFGKLRRNLTAIFMAVCPQFFFFFFVIFFVIFFV